MLIVFEGGQAAAQEMTEQSIEIGVLTRGALTSEDGTEPHRGSYADRYLFEATAGQQLEIVLRSGELDAYLFLEDPSGEVIGQDDDGAGGLDSRIALTIPLDGTYTVMASSYTSATGSYELLVRQYRVVPVAFAPLEPGRAVQGALTDTDGLRGDGRFVDGYVFNGISGDRIHVRLTSPDFDTYLILISPLGEVLGENDDRAGGETDSELSLQLPYDGEYRVLATSYSPAAGDYTLSLQRIAIRPVIDRMIGFGESVGDTLHPEDGTWALTGTWADGYAFAGQQGEHVQISMTSVAIDPYLILLGPDGTVIAENDDSGASLDSLITVRLPVDGAYRIIATSYRISEGPYTVALRSLVSGPVLWEPLALGVTMHGVLTSDDPIRYRHPSHLDVYRLELETDQRLLITMRSQTIDTYLWLVAPSGERIAEDDNSGGGLDALIDVVVPFDGTYLLAATTHGQGLGEYDLTAALTPGTTQEVVTIGLGARVQGRLSHGDDRRPGSGAFHDTFRFVGRGGQHVEIRMDSLDLDTYLVLNSPAGMTLADDDDGGRGLNSLIQTILPEDGQYTIYATSFSEAVGDYTISLAPYDPPAIVAVPVAIGDSVSGSLDPTDPRSARYGAAVDVYALTVDQGQHVAVTMTSPVMDSFLVVVDPNGEVVKEDDDGGGGVDAYLEFVSVMAGEHRVLATSATFGEGAYQIAFTSNPASLASSPFVAE